MKCTRCLTGEIALMPGYLPICDPCDTALSDERRGAYYRSILASVAGGLAASNYMDITSASTFAATVWDLTQEVYERDPDK